MNTRKIFEKYNKAMHCWPARALETILELCDEVDKLREQNDNQAKTIKSLKEQVISTHTIGPKEWSYPLDEQLQEKNDRQFDAIQDLYKKLGERDEQLKSLEELNSNQNDAIQSLMNDLAMRDNTIKKLRARIMATITCLKATSGD